MDQNQSDAASSQQPAAQAQQPVASYQAPAHQQSTASTPYDGYQAYNAEAGPGPSTTAGQQSYDGLAGDGLSALPSRGRGGRGSRGPRGSGRGRGRGGGKGSRGPRGGMSAGRTSTRIKSRSSLASQGGKLKTLKLSFKTANLQAGVNGEGTSFLGDYDRELDEHPEEPLAFEEQFILRVPKEVAEGTPGKHGEGLRDLIKNRKIDNGDVSFKFLDSRRAVFKFKDLTYAAKLVDLPNILEGQKTLDNKHLFKVADISQMLVVTHPISSEASVTEGKLTVEDYIWPHGITPPLRHVRKRRFRKRISRLTIEKVEDKVEELMQRDHDADEPVEYQLLAPLPDPNAPDSAYYPEIYGRDPDEFEEKPYLDGSEYGDSEYNREGSYADWDGNGTEGGSMMGEDESMIDESEMGDEVDEQGDLLDNELAKALAEDGDENDMTDEQGSGSDDGSDSASASDDEDDDGARSDVDDETKQHRQKQKLYNEEIRDLEKAVESKKREVESSTNIIVKKRFQDSLRKLQADLDVKLQARQANNREADRKKQELLDAKQKAADEARAAKAAAGNTASPSTVAAGTSNAASPRSRLKSSAVSTPGMQEVEDDDLFEETDGEGDDMDVEGGEADKMGMDSSDTFNAGTPSTSLDNLGDPSMYEAPAMDSAGDAALKADAAMDADFEEGFDGLFGDDEDEEDLFGDGGEGEGGQITDGALASGGLGDIAALSQMNLDANQSSGDFAGLAGLAGPSYGEVGMRRRVEGADDDDDDSDEESD